MSRLPAKLTQSMTLDQPVVIAGARIECNGPDKREPRDLPVVKNQLRQKTGGIVIAKDGELVLRNCVLEQITWSEGGKTVCNVGVESIHPTARVVCENVWVKDGQGFRLTAAAYHRRVGGGTLPGTTTFAYDTIAGDCDTDMAEVFAGKIKVPWRCVKRLEWFGVRANGGRGESALRLAGVIDARITDSHTTFAGGGKESEVHRAFLRLVRTGGSLQSVDVGPRGKSGSDIEWIDLMSRGRGAFAAFIGVDKVGYARACANVSVVWSGGTTAKPPASHPPGAAAFFTAGYRDREQKWHEPKFMVAAAAVCAGYPVSAGAVELPGARDFQRRFMDIWANANADPG